MAQIRRLAQRPLALTWLGKPLFSLADATVFGRRLFGFAAVWKPYVVYTKYFGILALTAGLRMEF